MRWNCSHRQTTAGRVKDMKLQYRLYSDVGGPYPNYQWSEWVDVPEHWETPEQQVTITAESVQWLREKTDMPMMECKKALTACGGDMNAAIEWLRTRPRGLYI